GRGSALRAELRGVLPGGKRVPVEPRSRPHRLPRSRTGSEGTNRGGRGGVAAPEAGSDARRPGDGRRPRGSATVAAGPDAQPSRGEPRLVALGRRAEHAVRDVPSRAAGPAVSRRARPGGALRSRGP